MHQAEQTDSGQTVSQGEPLGHIRVGDIVCVCVCNSGGWRGGGCVHVCTCEQGRWLILLQIRGPNLSGVRGANSSR